MNDHFHAFISTDGAIIISIEAYKLADIEQLFWLASQRIITAPPNQQLELVP
jgi:hypothetical protein